MLSVEILTRVNGRLQWRFRDENYECIHGFGHPGHGRCDAEAPPVSLYHVRDLTDEQVIDAVLAGDSDAFAIVVSRYTERYARFAVRMLGNREDGEEALQDAFVRAYRALDKRDDKGSFGPWFHSILVNQCRTAASRRAARVRLLVHDDAAVNRAVANDGDPGIAAGSEVEIAVAKLEPSQREVFLMKYVEDMSYDEIAVVTGVGVSALKMRVKRTADRLRELMTEVQNDHE